ncbi:MAG TPA: diaminopimelate decarboxylase [Methylophaga aminisulfidivorans]|jgi:diaminopimelate decarboxylase|uniref:Diaminopimelate decarboxylase n=1 Tax=Methylophaga thalassica TaxID=40223 RepID=A0ABQ5TXQ3_9GAMM|nr:MULTISPECIES: diaminopimelate decarboxylase [Methylophaga]GLQ00983.1 diaminopimelate decarboxylase [Methylophaga thalassica]HIC47077.1 diaminopimelate decarboxylase [Methylophaga sp.]HIM40153.1 diaminopimelate decarboxylase [Methylophaga aminisulfidivorans]
MNYFDYQAGTLHAENVPVDKIAEQYGTPVYIYSRTALENHWKAFDEAFSAYPHLVCYAVKANSNLAVLNVLAKQGSGFDIVSMGELARVLAAGGDPAKTVFSGVGKTEQEIEYALQHGIRCFNVESIPELDRINTVAGRLGKKAPVSIRVNPDVDAQTHPYISTGLKENKFGIAIEDAREVYRSTQAMPHLNVVAVDCHIGSQLTSVSPFVDALERVLSLIDELAEDGIEIKHLDIGGGLGIHYRDETPPTPAEYAQALAPLLKDRELEILLEPGRAIAGNAGILLTKVEFIKPTEAKCFAIVDAAMNDLLRPALYQSWQNIQTVKQHSDTEVVSYDIVGPICETGDFLGKDRELAIQQGDLLAIRSAGAYGFAMSSNYNSRPRAAEVMVEGDKVHLVRERETINDLFAGEHVIQA